MVDGPAVVYFDIFIFIFTIFTRPISHTECGHGCVFHGCGFVYHTCDPFDTNHGRGSKRPSVACLFLPTTCSYKSATVERSKSTSATSQ